MPEAFLGFLDIVVASFVVSTLLLFCGGAWLYGAAAVLTMGVLASVSQFVFYWGWFDYCMKDFKLLTSDQNGLLTTPRRIVRRGPADRRAIGLPTGNCAISVRRRGHRRRIVSENRRARLADPWDGLRLDQGRLGLPHAAGPRREHRSKAGRSDHEDHARLYPREGRGCGLVNVLHRPTAARGQAHSSPCALTPRENSCNQHWLRNCSWHFCPRRQPGSEDVVPATRMPNGRIVVV